MSDSVILIVEDDPTLRNLTRRQFATLGFECVVVDSGEAAVAHDDASVGLILMDIGLPGIDGIKAAALIREREARENGKRVPIVALTGHSNRQAVLAAGMDDFLQKPALIADIQRVVEKFLC